MLCTACHNAGHHEDAHGHSHEEAHSHEGHSHEAHSHEGHEHETTAHITIYGGGFEIFTESEPFVAGEETVLLVHITSLSDFKPYEGKNLSASIISGGKENSHGLHTTAAKGIYKTELTAASEGEATIKFNVDGLLRGDYQSRMNGYAVGRQNGWMSANDIRELENMDKISEEQGGDLYLVNGNMIKMTDAATNPREKDSA